MIPSLEIANLLDLIEIADCDEHQTDFLYRAISHSGRLKNPLAVVKDGGGRMYLLDNPSIKKALLRLKVSVSPVQVIDSFEDISISGRFYAENISREEIEQFIAGFPRDCRIGKDETGKNLTISVRLNGSDLEFSFSQPDNNVLPYGFYRFIRFLKSNGNILPENFSSDYAGLNIRQHQVSLQIDIEGMTWDKISSTLAAGMSLPSDIFNFEFTDRIIGIDYPIGVLQSEGDPEEKQRFLYELINYRLNSGQFRYFKKGVILFN